MKGRFAKAADPITVKARDGSTDLYGLLFPPTQLDQQKKYPIINHIYPGPQGGSFGSWSFAAARGDAQALAELGFVVVEIEGMGNPLPPRSSTTSIMAIWGTTPCPTRWSG